MLDISDYRDYKKFLNQKLDELDGSGRGSRSRLARHIGCQTAYIAQVLRGSSHFSLEQGESINDFLGHTDDQGAYFLLLIQYARSSTSKLRKRFEKQIETMKKDIAALKNRLAASPAPSEEDQPTYYSSWVYAAVHALISVPGFQTIDKISERLNISKKKVNETIDFLTKAGILIRDKNGKIITGKTHIHLGSDSPLISKHHMNWRLQAMRSIDNEIKDEEQLHYSSVISVSHKDKVLIKNIFIDAIKKAKEIVKQSQDEDICCLSLDIFSL